MKTLDNLDKEDKEFLRQVVLTMIANGTIRLPEIDLTSGSPDDIIFRIKAVFRRALLVTNASLSELDEEMTKIRKATDEDSDNPQ